MRVIGVATLQTLAVRRRILSVVARFRAIWSDMHFRREFGADESRPLGLGGGAPGGSAGGGADSNGGRPSRRQLAGTHGYAGGLGLEAGTEPLQVRRGGLGDHAGGYTAVGNDQHSGSAAAGAR